MAKRSKVQTVAELTAFTALECEALPHEFIEEMDLLDSTEIIQVVRRPDQNVEVDASGMDVDVALSLLVRAFVRIVMDEVLEYDDEDDGETS